MKKVAKPAGRVNTHHEYMPAHSRGLRLNFNDLLAHGFVVDQYDDGITIDGAGFLSEDALDHARALGAELQLDPNDIDTLVENAVNLSLWARLRRLTSH